MKNKLTDLNNHLFAQLERLGNEDLTGEALESEIDRSKAVTSIGKTIIDNAALALKAKELQLEYGIKGSMHDLLEDKSNDQSN